VAGVDTGDKFVQKLKRMMMDHDPPLDIKTLADSLGLSYEHVRKLVRGLTLPSKLLISHLARFFEVEEQELAEIVKRDQIKRKYGNQFSISPSNPGLSEIVSTWNTLTDPQKMALLSQLDTFVAENTK
jgi:plasmid maintenance system antidote protein VapI